MDFRELLIFIPEDQRRNGVKNADLIGDLPAEKALGIQWNIPDDSFTFNIQVNRRPLTKRKMLSIISSIYDPLGLASPFVLEGRQLPQTLCNQHVQWNNVVGPEFRKDHERWEQNLKRCWRHIHIKMYQASHVWKDHRNQPSSFLWCLRKRVWPMQLHMIGK